MPSKKPLFIFLLLFCSLGYDAQAQKVVEDRWAGKKIPFAIKPDKETVELLGFGEYDDKDPRVSSILFKKRINFNYTQFPKWANFLGAQFSKEADFNFTRFPKGANFTDTQFSEKASFRNARFLKEADFSSSQFSEEAHFNAIEFLVNTSFVWTKFSREVNFSDAQFSEGANFIWTQFPERAFLLKVQFSKEASFYMAQFSKWANFDFSHFEGSVDFNGSELPDILYFRGVTSKEIIRLDYASTDSLHKRQNNTNAKCKLFLNTSSSLDKFVLDANKFELAFDSTTKYEEKLAVYQQVIKKCNDVGFNESVRIFDIDLQKLQISHSWGWAAPAVIWLSEYWWDFGYDKSKAYRNTAIAFGFSFLLLFVFFRYFLSVYSPPQLRLSAGEIPKLGFGSRFKIALFYTALLFFSWKMEHEEVKYREHPWGALVIYLVFTVGIIHLAYLAGAILNK